MKRSIAAGLLVTALGVAVLGWGTDGFRAYTAEAARRETVLRDPRPIPLIMLEDQHGQTFRLQDLQGKLVAVEFIYTGCETICRSLGVAFRQIAERVPPDALGRDLVLVSISFDPRRDDPARLAHYAEIYGADGRNWRIARIQNESDLPLLLDAFGIVVIPDGLGGFEHNAAIHLVDRGGRLAEIADIGEPRQFSDKIKAII